MGRRTPLYDLHVGLGARMVDFGGWDMPVNYGSQIEEHHAVRQHAGIFDVSHMCVIDAKGPRVRDFFSRLIANDVAKLKVSGKALYSCMLNEQGGVIDDLIIYFIDESWFRIVVNAGTRDKDLAWMRKVAEPFGVELTERADLGMLAVQGPNARNKVAELLPPEHRAAALALEVFSGKQLDDWFVARTGYTGEDGFELYVDPEHAPEIWRRLLEAGADRGIAPAGLGARDTLRLEAAMALYGHEIDETTTPFEAGLAWVVKLDKGDFLGRAALAAQQERGIARKLVGFEVQGRGIARQGHTVVSDGQTVGAVTSGTWSPTFEKALGMAYVPVELSAPGTALALDVRGKAVPAVVVEMPFYRRRK